MASITPTLAKIARGVHTITWLGLSATDTAGLPLTPDHGGPFRPDKTVHVLGDFGSGGTILMQASNDGTNWITMTDIHGNAASYTAAALDVLAENPLYMRPLWSAGTGGDIDVILVMHSIRPLH